MMNEMNRIVLKKNGFHFREYDEKSNVSSLSLMGGHIGMHLQHEVEVEKNVTVEDLMKAMMKHETDIDTMFFGASRGLKIRPFYEEVLRRPKNKRIDLAYAELSWSSDYSAAEGRRKTNEVSIYIQMNGMADKKKGAGLRSYSLIQTPLNDWKHLPLKISKTLLVYDFRLNQMNASGEPETRMVTLLEAEREMTLYDLIGGFMDNITWYGEPKIRDERVKEMEVAINEPDEDIFESSMEDKEYELEKAIEREDYELAAVLKKQIDALKKSSKKS